MLLGAQHQTIAASTLVIGGRGKLLGYSLFENAGSPAVATVDLYDGVSTGGRLFHRVGLALSGVANQWFGPQGIQFNAGIFVGAGTGSFTGTIYFIAEELVGSNYLVQSDGADARILEDISLGQLATMLGKAL